MKAPLRYFNFANGRHRRAPAVRLLLSEGNDERDDHLPHSRFALAASGPVS